LNSGMDFLHSYLFYLFSVECKCQWNLSPLGGEKCNLKAWDLYLAWKTYGNELVYFFLNGFGQVNLSLTQVLYVYWISYW